MLRSSHDQRIGQLRNKLLLPTTMLSVISSDAGQFLGLRTEFDQRSLKNVVLV